MRKSDERSACSPVNAARLDVARAMLFALWHAVQAASTNASSSPSAPIDRSLLDEAVFAEAWEQGRALTVDEAVALALDSLD